MNSNIHLPVLTAAEETRLRDLHGQFLRHVTQLYPGMEDKESFEEFVVWWTGLDNKVQRRFEADFAKGCEALIRETTDRLTRVTKK